MFHFIAYWADLSSVEWVYVSFCAFCFGMLVGGGFAAFHLDKRLKQIKEGTWKP